MVKAGSLWILMQLKLNEIVLGICSLKTGPGIWSLFSTDANNVLNI